jgi:hypothetical protein
MPHHRATCRMHPCLKPASDLGAKADGQPSRASRVDPLVSSHRGCAAGRHNCVERDHGGPSLLTACFLEEVGIYEPRRLDALVPMPPIRQYNRDFSLPGWIEGLGTMLDGGSRLPASKDVVEASRTSAAGYQGSKVIGSPRDRYGMMTLISWWSGCLGIKSVVESIRTREHGTWRPFAPRPPRDQALRGPSVACSSADQVGLFTIGDGASRCHRHLGDGGTKAAEGSRSHI